MIPANSNTLNEDVSTTTINTMSKEDNMGNAPNSKTEDKQVVINNFYIPNGEGGWNQLQTGKIPPVSLKITGEKTVPDCNKIPTTNNGDKHPQET